MKGWFKPCGLHAEFPENEVVAGAIDFLMGLFDNVFISFYSIINLLYFRI